MIKSWKPVNLLLAVLLIQPLLAAGPQTSPKVGQKGKTMQQKPRPSSAAGQKKTEQQLPDPAKATEQAPATYRVRLETTKGPVVIEVIREWAPKGADRFYNLVKMGFYNDVAFFRVITGFMAQCGISGNPAVNEKWRDATIEDDPVRQSNQRGFLSFATAGPNTRTTQLFVNYTDNGRLDRMGFAPFGRVIEGMEVIDTLFSDYGEGAPRGQGPRQDLVEARGNTYLRQAFPQLDYITTATIVKAPSATPGQ